MTDSAATLSLKFAVDSQEVKTGLNAIGEEVKRVGKITESAFSTKQAMGVLDVKSISQVKAEMSKLTAAYRTLASSGKASTTELEKALASLRSKQKELYATISNPPKLDLARSVLGIDSQNSIAAQINKVKKAYATLASSGKANLAELSRAKVAMGQKIDELKRKTNNWRDALGEIKGKMAEAAAASAALGLAVKAGINFETAMAGVSKVVEGTPEQIAKLGTELQKLTRTIPKSATELAKIAAAGGQLGIAADEIVPFVEVTAKMATAFDMTAEEAGDAIGKLKNVFGLSIAEISEFGDAINQLGNNTAAREKDIVNVMLRVGGTSKQFGLAKEQTAALAAAMISLGKPPEVAATSINALLNKIQTATMQAPAFHRALAKIGTNAEEMAAKVAADPQKALLGLLDTLEKLDGQERAEVLTGLFGTEFQDDIGVLVGSLETYRDALGQVSDKTAYAGAMEEEFRKQMASTGNQLILLKNEIVLIATNIGTQLLPAIKKIAQYLTSALQYVGDLTFAFPKLTAAIATFATGALVFGTIKKSVTILSSALTIFSSNAVTDLGKVGSAAKLLATPFKYLSSALLAFTVGWEIGSLLNNFEVVQKAGIAMASGIQKALLKTKKAWAYLTGGDTAAIQQQIDEVDAIYSEMFANVGKDAKKAAKEQVAAQKQVTADSKKALDKQVENVKVASSEMKDAYEKYAKEVKRLQDDIADREKSLAEDLREMARSGMSDMAAWKDLKNEIDEIGKSAEVLQKQAEEAFAAGNYEEGVKKMQEAVDLYDKARDKSKELNTEVKNGDEVVQTQQESLKIAMESMETWGAKGITAQKDLQEAIKKTAEELDKKTGYKLSEEMPEIAKAFKKLDEKAENLADKSEKFNTSWSNTWDKFLSTGSSNIKELEKSLQELVKDRTITITTKVVEAKSSGGIVGALKMAGGGAVTSFRNMLAGGHFPGFGGGDRRHVIGEDGEYMLDKYRVRDAGFDTVQDFHRGDYGSVIAKLLPKVKGAIYRSVGGIINHIPVIPPMPSPQYLSAGGEVGGGSASGSGQMIRHEHILRAGNRSATVYSDDINASKLINMLSRAKEFSS